MKIERIYSKEFIHLLTFQWNWESTSLFEIKVECNFFVKLDNLHPFSVHFRRWSLISCFSRKLIPSREKEMPMRFVLIVRSTRTYLNAMHEPTNWPCAAAFNRVSLTSLWLTIFARLAYINECVVDAPIKFTCIHVEWMEPNGLFSYCLLCTSLSTHHRWQLLLVFWLMQILVACVRIHWVPFKSLISRPIRWVPLWMIMYGAMLAEKSNRFPIFGQNSKLVQIGSRSN